MHKDVIITSNMYNFNKEVNLVNLVQINITANICKEHMYRMLNNQSIAQSPDCSLDHRNLTTKVCVPG